MPTTNSNLPVPHVALHTAHTAVSGLLRSFPVPTPVGVPNLSATPLKGSADAPSKHAINDIAMAAVTALASNATLFKGRVTPVGYSGSNAGSRLSPAAQAVMAALVEDDSRRLGSIDTNIARPGTAKPANRLTDAPEAPPPAASVLATAARSVASRGSTGSSSKDASAAPVGTMTLRTRTGSALPPEMRKQPTPDRVKDEAVISVKVESEAASGRSPDKKKRGVEKAHAAKPTAAVKREVPTPVDAVGSPALSEPLLTPSSVLPKSFSVADCVRTGDISPNSLAALSNVVQSTAQPFQGLDANTMASYLLGLVAPLDNTSSTPSATSAGAAVDANIFTMALRTVACASCLGHRSMDVAWLSDDTVDGLLTNVRTLITHLRKATAVLRKARQEQSDADLKWKTEQKELNAAGSRRSKRDRDPVPPPSTDTHHKHGKSPLLPPEYIRLLEALRVVSRRLASIVADASRGVFADVAVLRVEEIAYDLITLPYEDETTMEAVYEYIGRDALLLVQLVWNRVEQGRDRLFAALCARVPTSPQILRRLCDLGGGATVMPLSVVFVCAAQSWPLYASEITTATVDAFHQQHAAFATLIITKVFAAPGDEDSNEVRAKFVVQFAEDLCVLLGAPSFPVADNLLRLLLTGLAKAYLSNVVQDDSASHAAADGDRKSDAKLRVLVVDVIGKISLQLHHLATEASSAPIDMTTVEEVPFQEEWQRIVSGVPQAHAGAAKLSSPIAATKKGKKATADATATPVAMRPLSIAERVCCTIYTTLTSRVGALSSDMAVSAREFHTRRAYIFSWTRSKLLPLSREGNVAADAWLDRICRRMSNAQHSQVAADMDDETLRALTTFVLSQQAKCALHSDSREALITLLLQAVKLQQHGASWDNVRKKALSHVSKLLDIQPSLLRTVWPIAVQSVRDDAARVRESSVPLLQKILDAGARGVLSTQLAASEREEFRSMVGNVFAALSMLLSDKSSIVLARTLGALEDVFTSPTIAAVLSTPEGEMLMRFLQTKVCALFDHGEHGKRFHGEVVHLFASRWLVPAAAQHNHHGSEHSAAQDEDTTLIAEVALSKEQLRSSGLLRSGDASNAAAKVTIKELTSIVCRLLSPPYEVELSAGNSGVQLLQELHRLSSASGEADISAAAAPQPAGGAPAPSKTPRKTRKWCDAIFVQDSMRHVVRRLVHGVMSSPPQVDDVGAALATLHAITIANPAWVEGMVEPISALFTSYDCKVPAKDDDAARCVQSARILRTLLMYRTAAAHFPLDAVVAASAALVAKYNGPLEKRVLVAAIGVLSAAVEESPSKSNCKQLKVWYQLVNGCYLQAVKFLRSLTSGMSGVTGNEVGYISRFTFSLSEFLRSYHGWGKPAVAELLADPAMLPAGTTSRVASERGGIAVSVQWFIQQCRESAESTRLAPLMIRLVGSLCIVDPSTYFRRNEGLIQHSLEATAQTQAQVQALLIVRDFLVDEDARVLRAAEQQAQRRRAAGPATAAGLTKREPSMEDLNSGMGTWVIQRFHGAVVAVATQSSVAIVRQLAMEIMDVALQQGLIPPAVLVEALIALCADREHPINSERAQRALATIAERHEDVIAPKCASGVIKSFTLLQALAVDGESSGGSNVGLLGVVENNDLQPQTSVHDLLFRLVSKHKKHRENLIVGLMRALYQPSKAMEWVDAQQSKLQVVPDVVHGTTSVDEERSMTLALGASIGAFLQYLTTTIALAPFATESDVLLVLTQCTVAIDMHLQSWTDAATKWSADVPPILPDRKSKGTKASKGTASSDVGEATTTSGPQLPPQDVMSCVGVLLCVALKRCLRKEYGISTAKLERYKGASGAAPAASSSGGGGGSLAKRESKSVAMQELLARTTSLRRLCSALLGGATPAARSEALRSLTDELDEANQEECAQLVLEGAAPSATAAHASKKQRQSASAAAAAKAKHKKKKSKKGKGPQKRGRDEEDSNDDDCSDTSTSSSESSNDEE